MAKIDRYNGNLKAFSSSYTGNTRKVFGSTSTESDDLDDNINPSYLLGWQEVAESENPPKEWFNAIGYTSTQLSAYLHQMGVAEWNTNQ